MRMQIERSPWIRPLFAPFGGSAERSFVELEDGKLHVRFGWLFDEIIPLKDVASIERARWPLLGGLGWRTNFFDTVALVGSYRNVVLLRLHARLKTRMLLPLSVEKLYVSVENPDAIIEEVRREMAKVGIPQA